MNGRHEPLDPEERALARLLADAERGEAPSELLDARILAAARDALRQPGPTAAPAGGTQRHSRRPLRRWPMAMGLAATVTLVVGVAWQLREPPRPAAASVPAPAAEAGAAAETAGGDATATARPSSPMPAQAPPPTEAPVASEEDDAGRRTAVAAASGRVAQRQEKAARQADAEAAAAAAREQAQQAATAAARQRASERAGKAVRQAAQAAPAPAAAAAPAAAGLYQEPSPPPPPPPVADTGATAAPAARLPPTSEVREAQAAPRPAAFAREPGLSTTELATLEADAALPADEWLPRIRRHRDSGNDALAKASLQRFVRAHPDIAIPEDLQALLH